MRAMERIATIFFLILCLTSSRIDGQVTQDMDYYYAAAVGSQLMLNYSEADSYFLLTWSGFPKDSVGTATDLYQCYSPTECEKSLDNTTPENTYVFDVSPPDYNLVVSSMTDATSTRYTASTRYRTNPTRTDSYYTISLAPLSCPEATVEILEGTPMELTCLSTFYQYTLYPEKLVQPVLEWTDDLGTDFSGLGMVEHNITDRYAMATINVTLTADYDDVTFTCNLTIPNTPAGVALEYEDSCSVTYLVTHAVSRVDIGLDTSNGIPTVIVGDVINCTTNGRPEPRITWVDDNGVELSSNFALLVTDDLLNHEQPVTCSCLATNSFQGNTYEASSNITFYVNAVPVLRSGGVEAWVIAVAVVVPVVVIAGAAIGGYFFYRHRKSKKAKKTKTASNGSQRVNSAYTAVSTTPDPYTPRPAGGATVYSGPSAAPRTTPPTGSGANTPAQGYGALGVQYYTGSNPALNTSVNSNAPSNRPNYPYNPRQGPTGGGVNLNPNPNARTTPLPPPGNPTYPYTGRQASVASSVSSRSSYHQPVIGGPGGYPAQQRPSHASSLSGSEV